jgi:hypothetical protein
MKQVARYNQKKEYGWLAMQTRNLIGADLYRTMGRFRPKMTGALKYRLAWERVMAEF